VSAGAHIIASDKTDTLIWRKGVKCTDAVTPVRVGFKKQGGDGEKFGGLEISERGRGPIFIAARSKISTEGKNFSRVESPGRSADRVAKYSHSSSARLKPG
jgi:hypothetical protein